MFSESILISPDGNWYYLEGNDSAADIGYAILSQSVPFLKWTGNGLTWCIFFPKYITLGALRNYKFTDIMLKTSFKIASFKSRWWMI